jgi:hypothetical protein
MNADDQLNEFKKVRKAEVPPFLYTRIQAQLDGLSNAPAPVRWVWTFAAAASLLVVLNIGVLLSMTDTTQTEGAAEMVQAMQLATDNDLYHD